MTDRELLGLAAKATGINRRYFEYLGEWGLIDDDPDGGWWNPLTNDGDAFRLAVKLKIEVDWTRGDTVQAYHVDLGSGRSEDFEQAFFEEELSDDPYAVTRRAIVRAAAETGRSMNE